jgi:hypothetical protein
MLELPQRGFAALPLQVLEIRVERLVRISRRSDGEPHFGRSGANRFDDPAKRIGTRYGVCYFGLDLHTALAETVLHDEMPSRGQFHVSRADFQARTLVTFATATRRSSGTRHALNPLRLADLTGAALKRLGGNGALSTITPYDTPQAWSRAVHHHPTQVDGIVYVSRHLNDRLAVAVFDRAAKKLGTASYAPLKHAHHLGAAIVELGIVLSLP